MKKFLAILALSLVCVISAIGFVGCGDTNTSSMKKHEIELTLDNYLFYLDVNTSIYNGSSPYVFNGCLTYAFYDTVCVSFEYVKSYSYGEPTTQTYVLQLNANGHGSAPVKDGNTTVNLVDISGKVIFWM